ncbi:caspase family protein [Duganella sp. BuS-21]|uniref:caspase family protein n=1 Tax=Duganella sp. BuS-21 TaxID=2943848 RepID=UPI0035A6EAD8
MAESHYILAAGDPQRACGTVYLAPQGVDDPATHVLVIGVAAYLSLDFPDLLRTASLSARKFADWFIGQEERSYTNRHADLGSLAMVLSETRDDLPSQYAGGPVPRANFGSVRTAVRQWATRASSHQDNLAILYIVGHGESFMNRTAFLLDDYGMDEQDATAGMAEVEQLISSLENLRATRQLLFFDCCRNPTAEQLPWNEPFGTKLISLARKPEDHTEPRKQWAVCSTSLREYAYGALNGPTYFNNCLMEGFGGVASDVATADWPVMPGALVDRIDQLLALYRLPDEKQQTPAGRLAGTFPINYVGEFDNIAVYVSLSRAEAWEGCQLDFTLDGVAYGSRKCEAGQPPFHRFTAREGQKITAKASRDGELLGESTVTVRPPVCFLKIETGTPRVTVSSAPLPAARALGGGSRIEVLAASPFHIKNGAVVRVLPLPEPVRALNQDPGHSADEFGVNAVADEHRPIDLGGGFDFDAAPGDYRLILQTPDGRTQSKDISVLPGMSSTVNFATRQAPHAWMTAAVIGGRLNPGVPAAGTDNIAGSDPLPWKMPAPPLISPAGTVPPPALADGHVRGGGTPSLLLKSPFVLNEGQDVWARFGDRERNPFSVGIFAGVTFNDKVDGRVQSARPVRLLPGERDPRYERLNVQDETPSRFLPELRPANSMPFFPVAHRSAWAPPLFACFRYDNGRQELAALPSLGFDGNGDAWQPYFIVDGQAADDEYMTAVVVDSPRWTSLLGFLGARNFDAGALLLQSGLQQSAMAAMQEKTSNPLAAIAGALIAIASADPKVQQKWDQYLLNIANWFPDIPDGPILLGRRLLQRATSDEDIAHAHAWLSEGYQRGVPVYSLSLEWLARGLESLPDGVPELPAQRARARHIASRVDPRHPFTVLRLT